MPKDESVYSELHSSLNSEWLHLQLNSYDYYMSKPGRLDTKHGASLPMNEYAKVPIIRIYGNLPTGHQVLCHVHGIFPYIFLPYDGRQTDNKVTMNQKCAQLHNLLESKSKLLASKRGKVKRRNGNDVPTNALKYIANISLVKGVPFYGFHVGWSLFYKVSFLEVSFVNKLCDSIREGEVFGKQVDCYESQLPYLLQFTTDFNLFCCSWVQLHTCYFRRPILNTTLELDKLLYTEGLESLIGQFCDLDSNVLPEKEYPRIGNGLIEIDILPQFIKNIDDFQGRDLHHDFVEALNDTSQILCKPYVNSTKNIIEELELHRKALSLDTYEAFSPVKRLSSGNHWQSSKQYLDDFNEAKRRLSSRNVKPHNLKDFIQKPCIFENIKKPRDALSELWPVIPNFKNLEASQNKHHNIIDTLEGDYNIADLSENEGDDIENLDYPYIEHENSDGQFSLVEEGKDTHYKRASIDLLLTQSMAKRIKATSVMSEKNDNFTEVSKTKPSSKGIKHEKGSYYFRSPLLSYESITKDLETQGFPKVDYLDPYFGDPLDLRTKPYVYAGKRFEITSSHLFSRIPVPFQDDHPKKCAEHKASVFSSWKYLKSPPSYHEVSKSLKSRKGKRAFKSQIENPASKVDFYLKSNDKKEQIRKKKLTKASQTSLTHFSLEIHAQTSGPLLPDPEKDEVQMICWCLEEETYPHNIGLASEGIMVVKSPKMSWYFNDMVQQAAGDVPVAFYEDEFDLFDALIDLVLIFDPDILSGFEVHNSSWGYILERSRKIHNFEIAEEISRTNSTAKNKTKDSWGYSHASGIVVAGRHIINVWRALRSDLNLSQYTIENISFKLLRERLPHFSFQELSKMWMDHKNISKMKTVISYWLTRCRLNIALLQKQEYIPRITEQARLTGIDFYSVYYRGSQYKIESILSRICKSESFILLAPSRKQVQMQKALECVPLVMEPESGFYKSPLVVLDFQSLYPSVMIAHNYCYSTMIGRVRELKLNNNEIGVAKFSLRRDILKLLDEHIEIAPNGVAYVDSSIRKSTLAKMLEDILDTRSVVKKTMSDLGSRNDALKRILNSKQLALKLIANVTYGYASASFSGRMPCSDLADSIVQTGREILENAIEFIESDPGWGAKVVYGDTDSLFVYLPGKTRAEAFRIGQAMAKGVTSRNRAPIYLNFEKVYHPCLLLSKKRYVGFKYEKDSNKSPNFDAKGIETVRRDGHPAQQKITEKCLRILFETKNLSEVKRYVQSEFVKIHKGHIMVQDFCFAKEVKLGSYKSEKTAPPGAVVATRHIEADHRAKPQYKERVPYVVVKGPAGQLLRDRCLSPAEFLASDSLELDADYYINKTLVPPLERLFNTLGISIAEWASETPRSLKIQNKIESVKVAGAIAFMGCIKCKEENAESDSLLCQNCMKDARETTTDLLLEKNVKELGLKNISTVCRTCCYRYTHNANEVTAEISNLCNSYDCPVYYSRIKADAYINSRAYLDVERALESMNRW